ncbi:hypothetical protein [Winogradskyella sp. 3972H.M.0a.05]|uniref:hypothetical protein n=1 Tax=Winogradskyella sp. 3972H.M.0a.05 TaxID=2950277 RepID=UPI00339097E6
MKTNNLLSNKYKRIGWVLFTLGLISGLVLMFLNFEVSILEVNVLSIYSDTIFNSESDGFFKIVENSIADELSALCIIAGGIMVGFSKEKVEDEFISKLRTDSLVWAIIVNYIILALAIIFVYDMTFFNVLVFNMFTPLLFYIFRFNYLKSKA